MNWKEIFGTGAAIALAAWVVVFLCHLIAAPYGLYTDVIAQKKQASLDAEHHAQELSGSFSRERKQFTEDARAWQGKATETKTDCAVKEGINQTLQKQNRDQQASINGCLTQAMKMLTPEELKLTTLKLPDLPVSESGNAAIKTANILVITNKAITPVKLMVECNAHLVNVNGGILGLSGISTGTEKLSAFVQRINIMSPAWPPNAPMVALFYTEAESRFYALSSRSRPSTPGLIFPSTHLSDTTRSYAAS